MLYWYAGIILTFLWVKIMRSITEDINLILSVIYLLTMRLFCNNFLLLPRNEWMFYFHMRWYCFGRLLTSRVNAQWLSNFQYILFSLIYIRIRIWVKIKRESFEITRVVILISWLCLLLLRMLIIILRNRISTSLYLRMSLKMMVLMIIWCFNRRT